MIPRKFMLMAATVAVGLTPSLPAIAGQSEAVAALSRADAKIAIVSRHSSQPGVQDDQSFNLAHQKMDAARAAFKADHYDRAEMLADESSVLSELTAEKAKLATLMTSQNDVAKVAAPAQ